MPGWLVPATISVMAAACVAAAATSRRAFSWTAIALAGSLAVTHALRMWS